MRIESFFIIFSFTVWAVLLVVGLISDRVKRLKRRKAYYKWLEKDHKRLTQTVNFYRLQKELGE